LFTVSEVAAVSSKISAVRRNKKAGKSLHKKV